MMPMTSNLKRNYGLSCLLANVDVCMYVCMCIEMSAAGEWPTEVNYGSIMADVEQERN